MSEIKEYQYFGGGQWRSAESKKLFDVFRPYDPSVYARVPVGGRAEAKLAVEAAAKAFPAWSQTTPAERATLFFKAAEIVKRRRTEIADILAHETASTICFATFQQDLVGNTFISPTIENRVARYGIVPPACEKMYLSWHPQNLHMLRSVVGMGQVLFGSDFPYLRRDLAVSCRHEVESSTELQADASRAVLAGNVLTLFPRFAGHAATKTTKIA